MQVRLVPPVDRTPRPAFVWIFSPWSGPILIFKNKNILMRSAVALIQSEWYTDTIWLYKGLKVCIPSLHVWGWARPRGNLFIPSYSSSLISISRVHISLLDCNENTGTFQGPCIGEKNKGHALGPVGKILETATNTPYCCHWVRKSQIAWRHT